jgi:hypothetical protein
VGSVAITGINPGVIYRIRLRRKKERIANFSRQEEKVTIKSNEKAVTFVTFLNNCLIVKRGSPAVAVI